MPIGQSDSPDLRFRVARAIWDAMVNDEPPDNETLEREGFADAADAAINTIGSYDRKMLDALLSERVLRKLDQHIATILGDDDMPCLADWESAMGAVLKEAANMVAEGE